MTTFSFLRIFLLQVVLIFVAVGNLAAAEKTIDMRDPARVIQAYLRATYARDFIEAYRLISAQDRQVRDLNRYVQFRGAFSGFILQAAKTISDAVEIELLEQKKIGDRLHLLVRYRVPDAKKIAPLLLNWDPYRLNSLTAGERDQLLTVLDGKRRDGSLEMIDGEARFALVREENEWRVFLNWASGVKIPLSVDLSKAAGLEVSLSDREIGVLPGEIFEILLKVKNKTNDAITARIGHLVEPKDSAEYLDVVQCGFLLPVTIPAAMEQEYSGIYLLRGNFPEEARQLELKYDFDILK
jgi:Cytochrome c oxidase assembly protein CtaG/Cox11